MELSQFLARTVSPGGYFVITHNPKPLGPDVPWVTRLFPEGDHGSAAGYVIWAVGQGHEVYHAQAAFKAAELAADRQGRTKYKGSRKADNVHSLKSFWIDIDVKRQGDGKKDSACYPDRVAAIAWLRQFCDATGIPLPNQIVNSGYGWHCYWILEDPILKHNWQPYADAFKAAMIAHGFVGDAGLTADCARVLRPAGTVNLKSGQPVPVQVLTKYSKGDYPNQVMLARLTPYLGQAQQTATQARAGGSSSVLAGGTVSPIFAAQASTLPNMAANASAGNYRDSRPRYFQRISTECSQARASLAARGNGDPYPVWYLGWLTMLKFCEDGDSYVHMISDGDPRYIATNVDTHYARVEQEKLTKGLKWPTCSLFHTRGNPNICPTCPHYGRIVSPLSLGTQDGDLPDGYRRANGAIEQSVFNALTKQFEWKKIFHGDVHSPQLDTLDGKIFRIKLTYDNAGSSFAISTTNETNNGDPSDATKPLLRQGLDVPPDKQPQVRTFMGSFISKLRALGVANSEEIYSYGWSTKGTDIIGFSYAGELYRSDGRVESAPGADTEILKAYRPQGELSEWQHALKTVSDGRPDLQSVVAASFGAPLMRFTGVKGVVFAIWSQGSNARKSSVLDVARAVWGAPGTKARLLDTNAHVMHHLADTRALPSFWDEMRVGHANTDQAVGMIFQVAEGKEKGRLRSDGTSKPAAEWDTIIITASNQSLMDVIQQATAGTDAGALRLFEMELPTGAKRQDVAAMMSLKKTNLHYGRAGQAYAAFLGRDPKRIEGLVAKQMDKTSNELQADAAERFYVAGISAMLTGAMIANTLGITQFDVPAMKASLYDTFFKLRAYRTGTLLVTGSHIDIEQILALFMGDHLESKLVTDRFATNKSRVAIMWMLKNLVRVDVQVSVANNAMRIARTVFNDWCRKRNFSARSVTEKMEQQWNLTHIRAVLGGGTDFSNGTPTWVLEIPLTLPQLEGHRYQDPNAKPTKATAGVP